MEKSRVSIRTGTACFVMNASKSLLLEEELCGMAQAAGVTCFECCTNLE